MSKRHTTQEAETFCGNRRWRLTAVVSRFHDSSLAQVETRTSEEDRVIERERPASAAASALRSGACRIPGQYQDHNDVLHSNTFAATCEHFTGRIRIAPLRALPRSALQSEAPRPTESGHTSEYRDRESSVVEGDARIVTNFSAGSILVEGRAHNNQVNHALTSIYGFRDGVDRKIDVLTVAGGQRSSVSHSALNEVELSLPSLPRVFESRRVR